MATGVGRPAMLSVIEENLDRIPKLKRQGLTDEQVAKSIGVSYRSLIKYKKEYPQLVQALKKGKELLIEDLEDTLYRKALGLCKCKTTKKFIEEVNGKQKTKIEETTQEIPPDTGALCFCLKNLEPSRWKEMRDVNFNDLESRLAGMKSLSEQFKETGVVEDESKKPF